MRVVALLVVACGCRVAASSGGDAATTPRGDGLPDRVITDGALWVDLAVPYPRFDAVVLHDAAGDRADGTGTGDAAGGNDLSTDRDSDSGATTADGTCPLLGIACVGDEGCYPFPFESAAPGDTRCAFQGVGAASVPCQSQLECDGKTLCSAPGQPDSICLQRCTLANPRCPTGFECVAYFNYGGVGVCR